MYKYVKGKGGSAVFCEAIEKEMKLSIAAPLIEIFSQQQEPLSVPAISLLVAFVFSHFFLVWMPSGQDGKWSKEGKMSASLHDNDEDAPYGYIVP